jgi:hypothetical protein
MKSVELPYHMKPRYRLYWINLDRRYATIPNGYYVYDPFMGADIMRWVPCNAYRTQIRYEIAMYSI